MRIDAILLAALVAALPLSGAAQAPTDAEKKAAEAKKGAALKAAPAKDAKAPPPKAPPKATPKATPKAPPKAPPKADPKKAGPAKDAKKGRTQVSPNVTIYRDAKDAPVLRDKQGNVIPTTPEAYDVSSAVKKK